MMASRKFWNWLGRLNFLSQSSGSSRKNSSLHLRSTGSDNARYSINTHFEKAAEQKSVPSHSSRSLQPWQAVTAGSALSIATNKPCSSNWTSVHSPPQRGTITVTNFEPSGMGEGEITTPAISPDIDGAIVQPDFRAELEQVFNTFDADEDGKISASELRDVLESLGDGATEEEAILMLNEADKDGDGCMDLGEFISMSSENVGSWDELKAAFNIFDSNGEGYITAEKLHEVLSRLRIHEGYTLKECCNMIEGADRDGDGRVNFEDFKLMMA